MTPYVIDTDRPTDGPWRVSPSGAKYARVTMADGRVFHVGIEPVKRVRIRYKPRGTYGWRYYGFVRDANGKEIAGDTVGGSLGVRGLLKMAGLIPAPTGSERKA
jgi:hypothetical protein